MKNTLIVLFIIFGYGCNNTPTRVLQPEEKITSWSSLCGPTNADLNTTPGYSGDLTPLFKGLDAYHFEVTTDSEKAQAYFNQGFVLNFGFNHAEAARSFREAIRQDPE